MKSYFLDAWIESIRAGLVMLLPLTLLGALASVVVLLPVDIHRWFGSHGVELAQLVRSATMGIMGLGTAMAVSIKLVEIRRAKSSDEFDEIGAIAAISAAAYLIAILPLKGGQLSDLGYRGVFQAIVTGIATAEMIAFSEKILPVHSILKANSPLGFPLRSSLRFGQKAFLIIILIALFKWLAYEINQSLSDGIALLLEAYSELHLDQWLTRSVITFFNQLLWLAGINGGQIFLELLNQPAWLVFSERDLSFLFTFAQLGGAGATLGLILSCLLWVDQKSLRQLALISIIPAVLNVNELILFGIPIVFGRVMMLPFIMAPIACCLVSEFLLKNLGVGVNMTGITWSTPIFLSGYLATHSWAGVMIQIIDVVIASVIYMPFLRQLECDNLTRQRSELENAVRVLKKALHDEKNILLEATQNGRFARALIFEFREQLKNGSVWLAYQAQHDIEGKLIGAEALLRWQHPLCGMIPPDLIIRLAEDCDLIHELGEWVLNQACYDMSNWRIKSVRNFTLSINMSPLQLENKNWPNTVAQCISKYGFEASDIEFEVTEGRMLPTSRQCGEVLEALQKMRVHLAMDDFGMGSASLMYLQKFKVHVVKIDGCLTRGVEHDSVKQDIIKSVCALGRSRGFSVIAEYVESLEQRDILYRLGCNGFQGWLYSQAKPADEFYEYAKNHHV